MKPGRELDALVAEKVMGIPAHETKLFFVRAESGVKPTHTMGGLPFVAEERKESRTDIKPYSTDIAAAWTVVEKLQADSIVEVSGYKNDWDCLINTSGGEIPDFFGSAETVPHAICLAALKAVGLNPNDQ